MVSNTYEQAVMFVQDIKKELLENEDIIKLFGVMGFPKDTQGDFICQFNDGHLIRVTAKGSGQKVRGMKWDGQRPDLIVCDDLEDDEIVMNQERRAKFKEWFLQALLPCRSHNGIVRVVGTILHMDSLLENLMPKPWDKNTRTDGIKSWSERKATAWSAVRYAAHSDDYSQILWASKFPREELNDIRQMYVEQGNSEGYFQEYLNRPIDPTNAFFKKDDFIPETEEDKELTLNYYVGMDLAVSTKERRDYSVFVVGGVDSEGVLHIKHVLRQRLDSQEIIEIMFQLNKRYKQPLFGIETGIIEKSIGPFLRSEMIKRGEYLNLFTMTPTKDKSYRARGIQGRMRSGGVKFAKGKDWFPELQQEMLNFPRDAHDDQVDAISWLGLMLDRLIDAPTPDEEALMDWEDEVNDSNEFDLDYNRSSITGY